MPLTFPMILGLEKAASKRGAWLLRPRRCARKHGCDTLLVDVEAHKCQGPTAWIAPLVHETIRFVDRRTKQAALTRSSAWRRVGAGTCSAKERDDYFGF